MNSMVSSVGRKWEMVIIMNSVKRIMNVIYDDLGCYH